MRRGCSKILRSVLVLIDFVRSFITTREWGRFRSSKATSMVAGVPVVVKGELKLIR